MAEIHCTVEKLKGLLEANVAWVEADMPIQAIPEINEDSDGDAGAGMTKSWGLDKIGVPGRSATGSGVHVYVLDTGIRTTHKDFGGRAVPTLDLSTGGPPFPCSPGDTSCARDVHGHGTHCAGTVGGSEYGVANESTLHAVKVLRDTGSGQTSWII